MCTVFVISNVIAFKCGRMEVKLKTKLTYRDKENITSRINEILNILLYATPFAYFVDLTIKDGRSKSTICYKPIGIQFFL